MSTRLRLSQVKASHQTPANLLSRGLSGRTPEWISCRPRVMRKSRMGMMLRLLEATVVHRRSTCCAHSCPSASVV